MNDLRNELYEEILGQIDLGTELPDETLYAVIDRTISERGREKGLNYSEKKKLREILFSSLRRMDILSIAMEDESVTEIMVNGPEQIYIEQNGRLKLFDECFTTPEKLSDIVQQIAASVNRRINEASPMVDARLPDGSRANLAISPAVIGGPVICIRRFPKTPLSMEKLIEMGAISEECAAFLKGLVQAGYNIFISGGTGAGKTTFLGALAEYIPADERVITIEDSAELRLRNVKNLVRMECRPANLEGEYEITIRDLIKNALRMRPDRIIVGEIRSEEALDMLQAMNTGHDGSLSTGHANSAADMVSRIETMVLMGKELPISAIRKQIASGIDFFIHLGRLRDKSRRVLGVYEVDGMEEGEVKLHALFEFRETGVKNGKVEGMLFRTEEPFRHTEKWLARNGQL